MEYSIASALLYLIFQFALMESKFLDSLHFDKNSAGITLEEGVCSSDTNCSQPCTHAFEDAVISSSCKQGQCHCFVNLTALKALLRSTDVEDHHVHRPLEDLDPQYVDTVKSLNKLSIFDKVPGGHQNNFFNTGANVEL